MKNILFYKYIELQDLGTVKKYLFDLAKSNNLLGTILIASEGINGCLSGEDSDCNAFVKKMQADSRFSDIDFKEGITSSHTFKKLFVRIREEIVTTQLNVDMKNRAPYVEPRQLKQWIENHEVVMVDIRNRYEYDVGHFENAVAIPMDVHREFKDKWTILKGLENKKIVTYCTGGVRCEKASAFLREQGFSNIYQLHGGIIQYGLEVGNENWKGHCLVFDTRGAIEIDPNRQSEPITQCVLCHLPNASLHNCKVLSCDKRFVACPKCLEVLHGCCSKDCRGKESKLEQKSSAVEF